MKKYIYILLLPVLLAACEKDFPSEYEIPVPEKVKRTILIYAVNNSSLSYDFTNDSNEILVAASKINLSDYRILVYRTDSNNQCGLYTINKSLISQSPEYVLIKQYERNVTSTAPSRIKEVVDLSLSLYPNSEYDLIFWGHGMSWKPYFTDHNVVDIPSMYAYGGEYTGGITDSGYRETDWTEIDELADCVPDHVFDTIWFDCCYMTGIEVIYQFRDKCNTFVGYPSEVWSDGLAYDLVLPYLLSDNHDVLGAAESFFDYYNVNRDPVTIAVIDMSKLEPVADAVKNILISGNNRPIPFDLMNYSRTSSSPFYDFRQLFRESAEMNDASELGQSFEKALEEMTIYHAESQLNFSLRPWDVDNISGISTHYYRATDSLDEQYYRSLDWFKRVYN